jgi:hypothetical protein
MRLIFKKAFSFSLSHFFICSSNECAVINFKGFVVGSDKYQLLTSVPFLQIAPDTRAGGMGDYGVATTPDANSIHWNPSKAGFH